MPVTITPLDSPIGAVVSGVGIRNLDDEDARLLHEALLRHHMLLLRDQFPDDRQLTDFGRCFGTLKKSRLVSKLSGHDEIMVISNIREDGEPLGQLPDGEMSFHIDQIYQPVPCKAAILHAVEIPARGGDTLFANTVRAFEDLPEIMRRRIQDLNATHSFQYGATRSGSKTDENRPRHTHPLVRRIPETGRRALAVCRLMTDSIDGLHEDESRILIEQLCDHLEQPRFVYAHVWRAGDVLVWDNRCIAHARTDFSESERRLLKRVTIADDVPPMN